MNFSKSKYTRFCQCPKMVWLDENKPEEFVADGAARSRMNTGDKIGDLAMGLFGEYIDVTVKDGDALDLGAMIARTNELIDKGEQNICEASFSFDGLYCAVDILSKTKDGYAIYEVKSSASVKDVYIIDAAYQKYVLTRSGVNVTGVYIVNVDNEYVFDGNLDINKLFKITDVTARVDGYITQIPEKLESAALIMSSKTEPSIGLNVGCKSPYPCGYFGYCLSEAGTTELSVFDLCRMSFEKKLGLFARGYKDFSRLKASGEKLSAMQTRQIDCALGISCDVIDKVGIKKFLGKLHYPLYFLDFETMQLAVPEYVGTRPYEQIPFLYSLHYTESDGGEVKHAERLAEPDSDPRRAIAEGLTEDIPRGACVLAYNKSFECGRITELAERFPDLKPRLIEIRDSVVDLIEPFQSGMYYTSAMGGSFSIKSVLPALYPGDPELDYNSLDGVHNGEEAMSVYPKIKDMPPDERKRACDALKKYCTLDTLAMVKLWQKLKGACK